MNAQTQQAALANEEKVHRVVLAGMKLMYSPETFKMLLSGITKQAPIPQKLAMEVAGVMHLIDQKSQSGLTPDVVAPASVLLLFELAEFMRQSGAGNPTKGDIQAAIQLLQKVVSSVFSKSGKAVTGGSPQQQAPMAPPAAPAGLISAQQPVA